MKTAILLAITGLLSLAQAPATGPTAGNISASGGGQIAAGSICAAAGCVLNETANWSYAVMVAGTVTSCGVVATTAPTGTAIIVDVLKNGTSIYGANPKTTVALASTTYAAVSVFATTALAVGDLLTFKITQVDSNAIGQFVRVTCLIQ